MTDSHGKSETTDPEVLAAWPKPCPRCGAEWQRYGFMEWELRCMSWPPCAQGQNGDQP